MGQCLRGMVEMSVKKAKGQSKERNEVKKKAKKTKKNKNHRGGGSSGAMSRKQSKT